MLYFQDKVMKLGGIVIPGEINNISISQEATIENVEDNNGKTKATQPTGYDAAKISIDIVLEDDKDSSTLDQIADIQRLFKSTGQEKAKLMNVVNKDCTARGISKVYFSKLTTKHVTSESKRVVTLELNAPVIASITTKKKKSSQKSSSSSSENFNSSAKSKTTKSDTRSPVHSKKNTTKYVLATKQLMAEV